MALCPQHQIEVLDHMHRQPYGARLVHDGAFDVLAYPPGGVGGETEAALGIELVQRMHQSQIALLHQVKQRHVAVEVVFGDIHHQAQVALDHFLSRGEISLGGAPREMQFLLGREQRVEPDLVQVNLGDVGEEFGFRLRRFGLRRVKGLGRCLALGFLVRGGRWGGHGGGGRYLAGSTGLPSLRISKCSSGLSLSVLPTSAIFCPLTTLCPSFTRITLLWA